ncbi:MAG: mechanosensitive ion channel [Halobacteriovoraceae bacterium]|nr:mechanosensitive ion channel [Halobacteriovoraceae bacterium]
MENLIAQAQTFLVSKGYDIIGAILALLIGWIAINLVLNGLRKFLGKRGADPTLIPFLTTVTNAFLKVALIISLAGMVGIKTTSFIAVLSAAGLAIGLALKDSLGNFASGVAVLIFKPCVAGDFIEVGGESGTVKEVQIFHTVLLTPDNKTVILPNSVLTSNSMTNYSTQTNRRFELIIGIDYSDDFNKAKEAIINILKQDGRILEDPAPFARVSNLNSSSVDITVRAWVKKEDYWNTYFDTLETIKLKIEEVGCSFPFPQRVLTVQKGELQ